jgi:hypothetical protein
MMNLQKKIEIEKISHQHFYPVMMILAEAYQNKSSANPNFQDENNVFLIDCIVKNTCVKHPFKENDVYCSIEEILDNISNTWDNNQVAEWLKEIAESKALWRKR